MLKFRQRARRPFSYAGHAPAAASPMPACDIEPAVESTMRGGDHAPVARRQPAKPDVRAPSAGITMPARPRFCEAHARPSPACPPVQ